MVSTLLTAWCLLALTVTIHAAGLSTLLRRASPRLPNTRFWPMTRLLVWVAWWLLFLATVALLIPSAVSQADSVAGAAFTQKLSVGLSLLLMVTYGLGMLYSLKTHPELFASAESGEAGHAPWPMGLALATLAGVTVLVAMVSEIFVESVQKAAAALGMTPAFVGFIVVALVGGAAEMASAFSGARKNRLDLSVGIAL
jgi:Ca2+:H+ antiporter